MRNHVAVQTGMASRCASGKLNPKRNSSYTGLMSIVRNIAGIAKGMSITFGEIFEPTQVENYPDG